MAYVNTLFNQNFLEYASYVIKDRAIPHIDDGLKPVQRRIIHSLLEMDDGKFHKVANVVGHCMKYHPHGDASIYSALVVLANKDLFMDKQGNFGNIFTGDPSSAARYIETRILPLAREIFYNPEITRYEPSYDGRNREPLVFPAKIPVALIIGAEGIAVGMATKILPHNYLEVLDAVIKAIQGEPFQLYPDFPTAGMIDVSNYQDGKGSVLSRAKLDTKDPKKIVIRELPFGSTTESLIASMENAAKKNKIKISGINDFTTESVEIEIKLARGVHSRETVDALYAFTDCETSIAVNLLVIKDNMPVQMTVTEVILHHARQLLAVLKAELKLEENKLKDKLHARTLERIFVEERIYKDIEQKKTQAGILKAVKDGFIPFKAEIKREITDEDVERLLKIPIRRISLYDINKAKREIQEINVRLKEIRHHLKHLEAYAITFLKTLMDKGKEHHQRRTRITSFSKVDVKEAAQRNLRMKYDKNTGYLGYDINGSALFPVSDYDKVFVFRKGGSYSFITAPDKIFVDKGMLYCDLEEKVLGKKVFSILYKSSETNFVFVKRFTVDKYITGKPYLAVPENCQLLGLTTEQNSEIVVKYKPKPRLKILEETFKLKDFLIKGAKAQGVRLAAKEVQSARFQVKKRNQNGAKA